MITLWAIAYMLLLGLVQELEFCFVGLHSSKVIMRILDVNLAKACFFLFKYIVAYKKVLLCLGFF